MGFQQYIAPLICDQGSWKVDPLVGNLSAGCRTHRLELDCQEIEGSGGKRSEQPERPEGYGACRVVKYRGHLHQIQRGACGGEGDHLDQIRIEIKMHLCHGCGISLQSHLDGDRKGLTDGDSGALRGVDEISVRRLGPGKSDGAKPTSQHQCQDFGFGPPSPVVAYGFFCRIHCIEYFLPFMNCFLRVFYGVGKSPTVL